MTRQTWLLAGGAVAALLVWFILRPGGAERVAVDLVAEFDNASDKRPVPEVFSVVDATLGGETKRAVLVRDPSRLVYEVTVPDDGELRFSIGLLESEWDTEGDGVLFRVLITAGGTQEEVINVVLDPFHHPGDRAWLPLRVDLSEYSGETIQLFFNTNSSAPARPPIDDRRGDAAVWGDPRVIAR